MSNVMGDKGIDVTQTTDALACVCSVVGRKLVPYPISDRSGFSLLLILLESRVFENLRQTPEP